MKVSPDTGRIKKLLMIHLVMQIGFIVLFLIMAFHFQQTYALKGEGHIFINSLIATFVFQLLLLYPIYRFAAFEARREVDTAQTSDPVVLKQLRQRRLYGDVIKSGVFIAYAIFILITPPATFVMSTSFFSFLVTNITYLQCFNFTVKRMQKG